MVHEKLKREIRVYLWKRVHNSRASSCSNDLGGKVSQSTSLLTHVLGVIIVARLDVMFAHWFPPHIRIPHADFDLFRLC